MRKAEGGMAKAKAPGAQGTLAPATALTNRTESVPFRGVETR